MCSIPLNPACNSMQATPNIGPTSTCTILHRLPRVIQPQASYRSQNNCGYQSSGVATAAYEHVANVYSMRQCDSCRQAHQHDRCANVMLDSHSNQHHIHSWRGLCPCSNRTKSRLRFNNQWQPSPSKSTGLHTGCCLAH